MQNTLHGELVKHDCHLEPAIDGFGRFFCAGYTREWKGMGLRY